MKQWSDFMYLFFVVFAYYFLQSWSFDLKTETAVTQIAGKGM